jgi:hypothetical protein
MSLKEPRSRRLILMAHMETMSGGRTQRYYTMNYRMGFWCGINGWATQLLHGSSVLKTEMACQWMTGISFTL